MSEIAKMNIHQKMLKATDEIGRVVKGLTIQVTEKNAYKAVSEGDVLAAVKPIEIVNGIYSYPISRNITETGTVTNSYGKVSQFMRVETVYRFVNIDTPSDYVEVTTYGDGIDSGDKAPGKAMTYADKYALLKAYKIETGDDPDINASEDLKKVDKNTEFKLATKEQKDLIEKTYGDQITKLLDSHKLVSMGKMSYQVADEIITKLKDKGLLK